MNFRPWLRKPALSCSMHRSSITCASTQVIMRTLTPANEIVSVGA
jgi:hypothetical protein